MIRILKNIPIDFGQESVAEKTHGKTIAKNLVPTVTRGEKKTALDIGCRAGIQSLWLEDRGYDVSSIDIESRYEKCKIVDVNSGLPYPDDSFDLLWCSEVIEHLNDPKAVINEFKRVLRSGGMAILTTPNSYFWLFRLFSLFGLPPQRLQRADHVHFFHYQDLRELCPESDIYGFFPYVFLKMKIKSPFFVNFLSPTFVLKLQKV